MVMQYWRSQGARVSAAEADAASIQQKLYPAEARGIRASALERYLDENGFRALVLRGEWSDLSEHLAKGRPLIVCLGAGLLHYVVVVGLDGAAVMVNDPADRKLRKLDRAGFEKRWRTAGNWTLLALPRVDAGY
jgi:ABC-type bacteriocin/lantibiotic exporter with double-glycine peptidase domain